MRVKIFHATAFEKIPDLESALNGWIADLHPRAEVKQIQTSLGQDREGGERFVITVLYKSAS
jgi:hypothetical protein